MKWFYALFFTAAIVILAGSLYLIFGQKKMARVPSESELKYGEVLEKTASDSAWNKFNDLRKNNESFVFNSEGQVFFFGNLEQVDGTSVTLEKEGKKLMLKNENPEFKTGYFEQIPPAGQAVRTIAFADFKKGDDVSVVVSVNMETKKTRIVSVTKVIFNKIKEK